MDILRQRQNRSYVFAGGGALVALLAFFLLPYTIITINISASGATGYLAVVANATALAESASTSTDQLSNGILSQGQGGLWLLPILSILALATIALLLFRERPFAPVVNAPVATQKRYGDFALIGIAVLSILIQIIVSSSLSSSLQNYMTANRLLSSTSVSTVGHLGFWLYMLGMLVLGGAIVMTLIQANRLQTAQAAQGANIPGGMPAAQPWQTPAQPYSQPYPPQYPQQQYPPYMTGDASYQQSSQPSNPSNPSGPSQLSQPYDPSQYPSQQWPSSNPSQPPYQGQ